MRGKDPVARDDVLHSGKPGKEPCGTPTCLAPGAGPDSLSNSCGRCQYHLPKG